MQVDGGCHCGAITFEATIDPAMAMICHCTDCQTLSATAFRVNAPAKAADFKLLSGTPKEYVKVGESGNRRAQGFCGDCGTQIYATSEEEPRAVYMLRAGALRQRDAIVPKKQAWRRSALTWLGGWPDIPANDKG